MEGWHYEKSGTFLCSCNAPLEQCDFFRGIQREFQRRGLAFSFNDFGTGYQLSESERINRYLTASLPLRLHSSIVERFRPATVVMSQSEIHPKAKIHTLGQI